MSALNISNYRVTIAAGQEEAIVARGTRLRCLYASGPFRVGLESEATFPFEGGMAVSLPDGAEFSHLRLVNPGAAAITVEIVVSFGEFRDDRSTFAGTLNAAIVSMPAVNIASGQSVAISGTPNVNATISGTPNVNATISGTPNVNAVISGTPNVNAVISGTPTVNVTAGGTVITESNFAADTVQRICLAANVNRLAACIQNMGPATVRVGFTVVAGSGIRLRPGQALTLEISGEIRAICDSGTATLMRTWVSR